jgi:putative ABC transport system permease protein
MRGDVPQTIIGVVDRLQTPWPNPGWSSAFVERSTLLPWRMTDNGLTYVVRARPGELASTMREVERRLRALDPARMLTDPRPFTETRASIYKASRALAIIFAAVSVLLLLVTALGIVGLTSYWTAQRRQQIGVRRALGARRVDILRRFQSENLVVSLSGVLLGAVLGIAVNLALVGAAEMRRMEPALMLAGALFVVLLAQLAALWPSLRAAATPPAFAIRSG